MPRPMGSPAIGRRGKLAVARRVAWTPICAISDRLHSIVEGQGPVPDGNRATGDAVNATSKRIRVRSFEVIWYLFDAERP